MKFINEEHKEFYTKEIEKFPNADVYLKSLLYTLGLSNETRSHFKNIFNEDKKEINIDSLQSGWQTSTSNKITRVAFSFWNNCKYDSELDAENGNISTHYNVGELFNTSLAPYFYEGVKLRFPEYTQELNKENELNDDEMEL